MTDIHPQTSIIVPLDPPHSQHAWRQRGYGPKGLVAGHKDANLANGPKPKQLSSARRITGCTGHLSGVWLNPQEVLVDWSCLGVDVETGGGPWWSVGEAIKKGVENGSE
jgi:hypothetical protein